MIAGGVRTGEAKFAASIDHFGSPRLFTTASGAVAESFNYYPFGQELTASNANASMRYTGHERDGWGTGITTDDVDYMHARSYQPTLARFMQVDPLGGSIASPQSLNRFAYVTGNPMRRVDPKGREGEEEFCDDPEGCSDGGGEVIEVDGSPWWYAPVDPDDVDRHLITQLFPTQTHENPRTDRWQRGPCDRAPRGPNHPQANLQRNMEHVRHTRTALTWVMAGIDVALHSSNFHTWDFKRYSDPGSVGYGAFTNFHFGATSTVAGVSENWTMRGGGLINVWERARAGNFSGAARSLAGVFGFGPDAAILGDDSMDDVMNILAGIDCANSVEGED